MKTQNTAAHSSLLGSNLQSQSFRIIQNMGNACCCMCGCCWF